VVNPILLISAFVLFHYIGLKQLVRHTIDSMSCSWFYGW